MTTYDRNRLLILLRRLCDEYGAWAVLHEFATAMKPEFLRMIEAEKPPKRPRKVKEKK